MITFPEDNKIKEMKAINGNVTHKARYCEAMSLNCGLCQEQINLNMMEEHLREQHDMDQKEYAEMFDFQL